MTGREGTGILVKRPRWGVRSDVGGRRYGGGVGVG